MSRTSRLALNLFLTHAGFTRIIIPTVYRDDYISALKAMSGNAHPAPLVRMLAQAARFSRWLDSPDNRLGRWVAMAIWRRRVDHANESMSIEAETGPR